MVYNNWKTDSYGHPDIVHLDALFAGHESDFLHGKLNPYIVIGHFYDKSIINMFPIPVYSNTTIENFCLDLGSYTKKFFQIENDGNVCKIYEKIFSFKDQIRILKGEFNQKFHAPLCLRINDNISLYQTAEDIENPTIIGENINFETLEIIHVAIEITITDNKNIREMRDLYPFENKNTTYFLGWYHLKGPGGVAIRYDEIDQYPQIDACISCKNTARYIEVSAHAPQLTFCSNHCQIKYHS